MANKCNVLLVEESCDWDDYISIPMFFNHKGEEFCLWIDFFNTGLCDVSVADVNGVENFYVLEDKPVTEAILWVMKFVKDNSSYEFINNPD